MEIWKPIPGYEGLYEASTHGHLRSTERRVRVGLNGGIDVRPPRILQPGPVPFGHLRITLTKDGRRFGEMVHRLVARTFIPNPKKHPIINHLDSNPANNRIENLEWTTYRGNNLHSYAKGIRRTTPCKGETNGQARLTAEQVITIRQAARAGQSSFALAEEHNISERYVRDLIAGRKWKHL